MYADKIELIHKGNYLSYYEIDYKDDEGRSKKYEMVSRNGSNASHKPSMQLHELGEDINAVTAIIFNQTRDKMLISREFRFGINKYIYNIIAGLIDDGETPEQAIRREIHEETGLEVDRILVNLGTSYTCAPITDEKVVTFIVTAHGDITGSDNIYEDIESHWCTKEEVMELLNNKDNIFSGRMQAYAFMWANGIIGGI